MPSQSSSNLQSVERAVILLKAFDLERPERGVSELAQELGWHKSTVFRLLHTLENGGLLSQNSETGRYRLGLDLLILAAHVTSYLDVRDVSRRYLRQLVDMTQETSFLSVIDAGQIVNLEQSEPTTRQIMSSGRIDRRMTTYCTAAGKAILAYSPPCELEEIICAGLVSLTPHTITDPEVLKQELIQVRELGYATAFEELEIGMNAIAAPIFDSSRRVIAAVGVAGPVYRLTAERFKAISGDLITIAHEISVKLGFPAR